MGIFNRNKNNNQLMNPSPQGQVMTRGNFQEQKLDMIYQNTVKNHTTEFMLNHGDTILRHFAEALLNGIAEMIDNLFDANGKFMKGNKQKAINLGYSKFQEIFNLLEKGLHRGNLQEEQMQMVQNMQMYDSIPTMSGNVNNNQQFMNRQNMNQNQGMPTGIVMGEDVMFGSSSGSGEPSTFKSTEQMMKNTGMQMANMLTGMTSQMAMMGMMGANQAMLEKMGQVTGVNNKKLMMGYNNTGGYY